jgi:hypothetical protein
VEDNRPPHKLHNTSSLAEWKYISYTDHIFRTCSTDAQSLPEVKIVLQTKHPCFQSASNTVHYKQLKENDISITE